MGRGTEKSKQCAAVIPRIINPNCCYIPLERVGWGVGEGTGVHSAERAVRMQEQSPKYVCSRASRVTSTFRIQNTGQPPPPPPLPLLVVAAASRKALRGVGGVRIEGGRRDVRPRGDDCWWWCGAASGRYLGRQRL